MLDAATGLLRLLPAETAHRLTVRLVRAASPLLSGPAADDPRLAVQAFGLDFPNPIGLAAGFDKDAEVPAAMLKWGFGFVECGTITPRPQAGNPKPRLFRLPEDEAVINRMGFNNRGMDAAAARLRKKQAHGIVGLNIGANKDSVDRISDYAKGFEVLAPLASYIAVNVSSPNTPGLRGLQNRDELARLLGELTMLRRRLGLHTPLLLKIAPDLDATAMDDIAAVVLAAGIDGLIVSNTTIARPATLKSRAAKEQGGLSGKPLMAPSTQVLKDMRARLGTRLTLVGAGGVASGADAYEKIRAGASLVQLYTALAYRGPALLRDIKRELCALLARDGYSRVQDAVAAAVRAETAARH
ncbi:MAG: quinone-dependent dihydroorotate dehydrogenase [Alphaproteobacteria bacterium]|nr:quinone-dependent dihydroorotate dehydrogenase [Alphaproteobacteria bacterium]MBV9694881.1 quinone-dependent dihydroorotate dehydrogenase [Alphaproteobacteria bacterium]